MILGEKNVNQSSLEEVLTILPPSLRGFFQKVVDGVSGALQVTLMDTLVGEFHEKFNAMWNNPGDRDAAKAVRQCDRTHRETAAKVVKEVLAAQLVLLAKAVVETMKKGGAGGECVPDDAFTIIESKVTRLEEQITALEALVAPYGI